MKQTNTNCTNQKILACESSCFDSLDLFMEDQVEFLISLVILGIVMKYQAACY